MRSFINLKAGCSSAPSITFGYNQNAKRADVVWKSYILPNIKDSIVYPSFRYKLRLLYEW